MSGVLFERPTNINFISSHTTDNMSNAAFSQQNHDSDQWDHVLDQLEQQWTVRERVSVTLKEANALFAEQFTHPNAYKFMEACNRLTEFLDLRVQMEYPEQKLVHVSHVRSRSFADGAAGRTKYSSRSMMSWRERV